jgi:hypothetical protein
MEESLATEIWWMPEQSAGLPAAPSQRAKESSCLSGASSFRILSWCGGLVVYSVDAGDCRLTTQAQRPGPRDATIANWDALPGSLQRMVRPLHVAA